MKAALARFTVVPFEAAIAGIALYAGVAGLLGFARSSEALELLLPAWLVVVFQVFYVLGGAAILWGVARGRYAPEVFGLLAVATSIVVRSIAVGWFLGFGAVGVQAVVTNALFLAACAARYRILRSGTTLIRANL